jgi:LAO/AO transport system kinase
VTEDAEDRLRRLVERILEGDSAALARAITALESGRPAGIRLLSRLAGNIGGAMTVGFTGPPGVGKSTLINAFVTEMRRRGKRVAVLAVDPSSPVSGGAILGDRVRMAEHGADDSVFIRSIASRGHLGGLSRTTARVADLMDGAGFDVVVIETVGAGQSEVEVAQVADTTVVVGSPGAGDDVQAIKAGILEVADILVINKADREGAVNARRALEGMLRLRARGALEVPVLETVATSGSGVKELADAIEKHHAGCRPSDRQARVRSRFRALLADSVMEEAAARFAEIGQQRLDELASAVDAGDCAIDELAGDILERGIEAALEKAIGPGVR